MRAAVFAWKRFSADQSGVVSFEYVILGATMVATVVAVFGTGSGGSIQTTLTGALGSILAFVTAAAGG
jgi:Flp pilus assembly pilin Flp